MWLGDETGLAGEGVVPRAMGEAHRTKPRRSLNRHRPSRRRGRWRRREGVEPSEDLTAPKTGFEDQRHHRAPSFSSWSTSRTSFVASVAGRPQAASRRGGETPGG